MDINQVIFAEVYMSELPYPHKTVIRIDTGETLDEAMARWRSGSQGEPTERHQDLMTIFQMAHEYKVMSENGQGYIHIKFMGYAPPQWGVVTYRYYMSGGPDGEVEWNGYHNLLQIVHDLTAEAKRLGGKHDTN